MSSHSRIGGLLVLLFCCFWLPGAIAQQGTPAPAQPGNPTVAASQPPATQGEAANQTAKQANAPAVAASPVQPGIPSDLHQPLLELTKALTKLVDKKAEPEKLTTTIFDLLAKLGALVGTIVTGYASYKASKKIPWFKENKEFVATVVVAISVVVLFYLLSGIVVSVLYVLIAILVLLVALVIAAAHLIQFIDEKYPDVRDSILASFSESSSSASLKRLMRTNAKVMCDWLTHIMFVQSLAGEEELVLMGAFAEGFDVSVFRIVPSDRVPARWQIVDDRMLIPIGSTLLLRNSSTGEEGDVVNIQLGMIVIKLGNSLRFAKFNEEGFNLLADSYIRYRNENLKPALERQQSIAVGAALFKS